jgi:predicted transcriptional regulator
MKVELAPELEAKLDRLALKAGSTPEQMVAAAVLGLVGEEASGLAKLSTLAASKGSGETLANRELDSRGKVLPARHLVGGIITPQ